MAEAIDEVARIVQARSPQYFRAVMMAPVEKRPYLMALVALDMELWKAARASEEGLLVALRLQWWRDAIEKLPEGAEDAHALQALLDAEVSQELAMQMVAAYQEERESLPVLVRALADKLGANPDEMVALIHAVGDGTHKPKRWPEEARPIVAMLLTKTRSEAFKLALIGWA